MISTQNVSLSYGKRVLFDHVSIKFTAGNCYGVIGANGAGKSTTLRTVSGLLKPKTGSIEFLGEKIDGIAGHEIVAKGICHSPEGRRIFPKMTVDENLDLGAFLRNDSAAIKETRDHVLELFPRLQERINQKAGTMSGGEQQMLAVGRALMGSPKLLILDEPSMGLAPVLVDLIFETIEQIRKSGVTILLVEQNALAALRIADYAYVLESGHLKLEGDGSKLADDPAIAQAYLGG